jgi:hypothetical protein
MAPQISAAKDAMVERYSCSLGAMEVISLLIVIASPFNPTSDGGCAAFGIPNPTGNGQPRPTERREQGGPNSRAERHRESEHRPGANEKQDACGYECRNTRIQNGRKRMSEAITP